MFERKTANIVSFLAAIAVLIVGAHFVIDEGSTFEAPVKTTTVVEVGTGAGNGKRTATIKSNASTGSGKKGHTKETSHVVERPTGSPVGKKTKTVEEGQRSFDERALGETGLVLLQLGVVLLAAFITGALVQRAMLGDFSIKLGSLLELETAKEAAATDTVVKLTAELASLAKAQDAQKATVDQLTGKLAGELGQVFSGSAGLAAAIKQLEARIAKFEANAPGGGQ